MAARLAADDDFDSLEASSYNPAVLEGATASRQAEPRRSGRRKLDFHKQGDDDHDLNANENNPGSDSLFAGLNANSAWLKWSQERRASFKRRLALIDKQQTEMEAAMLSESVQKARKESQVFVSKPGSKEDVSGIEKGQDTKSTKSKTSDTDSAILQKELKHLAQAKMKDEVRFWNKREFRAGRIVGSLLSVPALALLCVCVQSNYWFYTTPVGAVESYLHSGLWQECMSSNLCSTINTSDWQNAVIGLLIFSIAFGFLATILSICGLITTALSKKIYYYHSAGEIYFICGIACAAALMAYPVAIKVEEKMERHSYGYGYGLGWGAVFCYFASAMCMCLDDLVRTIVRGLCCVCCKPKQASEVYNHR